MTTPVDTVEHTTQAAPPVDATADLHSEPIPGYRVERLLGRGGMGMVFLARDEKLQRQVALKMIAPLVGESEQAVQRFQEEARAVARMQHPNIAQVHAVGEFDGKPYLVMELLSGGSLADRLDEGPLPAGDAAEVVRTISRAIHACHQRGILHRDLKPANVLFAEDGTPKVTDFGLAKQLDSKDQLTRTGEVMGTPSYMAPEQASGLVRNLGPPCDVYALGAILYELLCGRPPFRAPDAMQTLMLVLSEDPVSLRRLQPRVPRDLETICLKCLEKSPAKRYESAAALADDLGRFINGMPIQARPVRWWERGIRWSRRRPTAAALIVVSLAAVFALAGGGVWYNTRLQNELARSNRLFDEGRGLTHWVLDEHLSELGRLRGGNKPREALVQRLLAYLDELSEEAADDLVLAADMARAYERIAEVQGDPNHFNLGRTRQALESYRKALGLYETLLRHRPGDAELNFSATRCRHQIALVENALGNRETATKMLEDVLSRLDELAQDLGDSTRVRIVRVFTLQALADIDQARGRLDGAYEKHQRALRLSEEIGEGRAPGLAASAHGRIGRICEAQGDLDKASAHYARMIEFAEGMQESIDDARMQHELSVALIQYGDVLARRGDLDRALKVLQRAAALRRDHAEVEPDGVAVQRQLVVALERIAAVYELQQRWEPMKAPLEEALAITSRLAELDPDDPEHRRDSVVLHARLGRSEMYLQNFAAAERHFRRQLDVADALVKRFPDGVLDWQGVAEAHSHLAALHLARPAASLREQVQFVDLAIASCERSAGAFAEIAKRGELTADQARVRESVARQLTVAEDLRKKLSAMRKPAP